MKKKKTNQIDLNLHSCFDLARLVEKKEYMRARERQNMPIISSFPANFLHSDESLPSRGSRRSRRIPKDGMEPTCRRRQKIDSSAGGIKNLTTTRIELAILPLGGARLATGPSGHVVRTRFVYIYSLIKEPKQRIVIFLLSDAIPTLLYLSLYVGSEVLSLLIVLAVIPRGRRELVI